MSKKTLVDVIYTAKQQRKLQRVWAGRFAMFLIRWIGNYMYVDILLETRDVVKAVRAAGIA